MIQRNASLTGILAMALVFTGCFTREETIEVRPDGSATVTYEVEGTREQLQGQQGLPSAAGWKLVAEETTRDEGDEKVTLSWERDFADLNDFPAAFAAPSDPHAGALPHMETRLDVEQQTGRTLYHFERRYIGRRAGRFQEFQEPDSEMEPVMSKLEEEGFDGLSVEEKQAVFAHLAESEAMAIWVRARDALGRAVVEGVIDVAAYQEALVRLEEHLDGRLTGGYLQQFFALNEDEQEEKLRLLQAELRGEVERALPAASRERILFLLEDEEKAFQVTESLGDEVFGLNIKLPGVVVSSNALWVEDGEASWHFDGTDLVEGDLVFTAVSVLEHDPGDRR